MTAVLTDIEGTTTDIAFVHKVLFPYARERLPDFVRAHAGDAAVRECLAEIREIEGADLSIEDAIERLIEWSDADRKIKPLKTLQGLIWTEGYKDSTLKGHVYGDVPPKLREWRAAGIKLYVYSSGSVAAQKVLFANTEAGDLTRLFSGYFDTGTGPKVEAGSYRKIAEAIGEFPGDILFLSDNDKELQAAKEAGLRTVLFVRGAGSGADGAFPVATSFDEINPRSPDGLAAGAGARGATA